MIGDAGRTYEKIKSYLNMMVTTLSNGETTREGGESLKLEPTIFPLVNNGVVRECGYLRHKMESQPSRIRRCHYISSHENFSRLHQL